MNLFIFCSIYVKLHIECTLIMKLCLKEIDKIKWNLFKKIYFIDFNYLCYLFL